MYRCGRRAFPSVIAVLLNVIRQQIEVACRVDDDADRHLRVEDLFQELRDFQRGQRIATHVGKTRIAAQILGTTCQRGLHCAPDSLSHRLISTTTSQRTKQASQAEGTCRHRLPA
jgi:hypothetical protein